MGSPKKRIQYRYDAVGNRVGMTDPDGGRFTYAYDAVNRITQVINPQGDRTSYAYDAGGRRTVKKLANGTRASFSYDAASNLTRLANLKSDGTTISSFNYDYDRVGNRTAVLEADGSRVTWSYDDTYQLTGEHRTGTTPYEDSYSYDAAGNRLLKIHDGARTTYSYDAANQLEWSEDASGRTTYTFDADGNQQLVVEPTGDRTTTSWDYENRTTLVQLPSGIRNTMAYEPGGLRVKLEESTGTKKFVWDDQNYLAETDDNDDTQVVYTNEPDLYGNLVSQKDTSEASWFAFDAPGSTREITDASETVIATQIFDAWGSAVVLVTTANTPFGFIGEARYYRNIEHSSLYVIKRTYDYTTALWTSLDPLWPFVSNEGYLYVANNPLNAVDPSGALRVECVWKYPRRGPRRRVHVNCNPGNTPRECCETTRPTLPADLIPDRWRLEEANVAVDPFHEFPTGECLVQLVCFEIWGGIGAPGPFSPTHCGVEITWSDSSTERFHVHGDYPWKFWRTCRFSRTRPQHAWTGTPWIEQEWVASAADCECIVRAKNAMNGAAPPYEYFPDNDCLFNVSSCNSNYAAHCLLKRCILSEPYNFAGPDPIGWNHRMRECVGRRLLRVETTSTGGELVCCTCDSWKSIDDDWCA